MANDGVEVGRMKRSTSASFGSSIGGSAPIEPPYAVA